MGYIKVRMNIWMSIERVLYIKGLVYLGSGIGRIGCSEGKVFEGLG